MRQGKSMEARELQDILNLLPLGAKEVTVISRRDCKISATIPVTAWVLGGGIVQLPWSLINEAKFAREPGFVRVIYTGKRAQG